MTQVNTEQFENAGTMSAEDLYQLGINYSTGRDGIICMVNAHKWLNLAAFKGNELAKQRRDELAFEMSREEISEAQRAAREFVTRH